MFDLELSHGLFCFGLRLDVDPESRQVKRELGVEFRVVADITVDVCDCGAVSERVVLDKMNEEGVGE